MWSVFSSRCVSYIFFSDRTPIRKKLKYLFQNFDYKVFRDFFFEILNLDLVSGIA